MTSASQVLKKMILRYGPMEDAVKMRKHILNCVEKQLENMTLKNVKRY